MTTPAKIFLLFCTVVAVTFGQQAATKTNEQHAYIIPGKLAAEWTFHEESRVWLEIRSFNSRDWPHDGFDPSYTAVIVKDYKPILRQLKDGRWEITFTSPIAELGDGIP